MRKSAIGLVGLVVLFLAACGGASVLTRPESTPRPEPIRVQPEIVDVREENDIPTAITIKLEDGSRLRVRLGASVNRDDWDLGHLNGHRRTNTPFVVTYEERPGEFVAIELSE